MIFSQIGATKKPVQLVLERALMGLPALAVFIGRFLRVRARKLNIKSAQWDCDAICRVRQILLQPIRYYNASRGAYRRHAVDACRIECFRRPPMIFAFVAGIMLGVEHSELPLAAGVIAGVLVAKAAIDVIWDRLPLLGLISPFVVYRYNLTQKGETTDYAWISYSLQMMVFGMAVGLATYALFYFVF
jgi:hypothetical protein